MRALVPSLAAFLLLLRPAPAEAQHALMEPAFAETPLDLAAALSEIQAHNPQLRAARARREAVRERLPQAAAWDDPRVGVDFERTNRRLNSYNDAEWSVSQTLPVTGKLAHRKEAA